MTFSHKGIHPRKDYPIKDDLRGFKEVSDRFWDRTLKALTHSSDTAFLVISMTQCDQTDWRFILQRREEAAKKINAIDADPSSSENRAIEETRLCMLKVVKEIMENK